MEQINRFNKHGSLFNCDSLSFNTNLDVVRSHILSYYPTKYDASIDTWIISKTHCIICYGHVHKMDKFSDIFDGIVICNICVKTCTNYDICLAKIESNCPVRGVVFRNIWYSLDDYRLCAGYDDQHDEHYECNMIVFKDGLITSTTFKMMNIKLVPDPCVVLRDAQNNLKKLYDRFNKTTIIMFMMLQQREDDGLVMDVMWKILRLIYW